MGVPTLLNNSELWCKRSLKQKAMFCGGGNSQWILYFKQWQHHYRTTILSDKFYKRVPALCNNGPTPAPESCSAVNSILPPAAPHTSLSPSPLTQDSTKPAFWLCVFTFFLEENLKIRPTCCTSCVVSPPLSAPTLIASSALVLAPASISMADRRKFGVCEAEEVADGVTASVGEGKIDWFPNNVAPAACMQSPKSVTQRYFSTICLRQSEKAENGKSKGLKDSGQEQDSDHIQTEAWTESTTKKREHQGDQFVKTEGLLHSLYYHQPPPLLPPTLPAYHHHSRHQLCSLWIWYDARLLWWVWFPKFQPRTRRQRKALYLLE